MIENQISSLEKAVAMLNDLKSISDEQLIRGCCTQGCCTEIEVLRPSIG